MGEITLTTFLLQEVLWELRALLVVLVPLSGCGVLVGQEGGLVVSWCFRYAVHSKITTKSESFYLYLTI